MKKIKISEYLLLFFPASLIFGPLIAEIVMNLISIIFLLEVYKKRTVPYINRFFLYLFSIFFVYIFFNSIFSEYESRISIKIFFFFRFALFVVAVTNIFLQNQASIQYFFKCLSITLLILVCDSCIQYFFGHNSLGFVSYRPDRISGFFGDKLVLGGYLFKLSMVYIALFVFLYKKQSNKEIIFHSLLIALSFFGILISGDRAPLFLFIIFIILIIIFSNLKKYFKLIIFSSIFLGMIIILNFNSKIYDRVITQTTSQLLTKKKTSDQSFVSRINFQYYNLIYLASYNAFLDKKVFGHGPNTFRHFCSNPKYEVINKNNSIVASNIIYKSKDKIGYIKITEIHFTKGQKIKKGDPLISYIEQSLFQKIFNTGKSYTYYADQDSIIQNTTKSVGESIRNGNVLATIEGAPISVFNFINGCTTHPHNFYLQLLAETGLLGFVYIFLIFLYFSLKLLISFFSRKKPNNFEIVLISSFVVILFPFTPNGNFFNNWLMMTQLLPVSLYLYSFCRK